MSILTLNDVLHHVDRPVTCHENLVRQITLMSATCLGSGLAVIGGLVFDATGEGARSGTLNTINIVSRYSRLCSSLASDVLITLSMFYYLKVGLNLGTRFVRTKCLVTLLISYTLTTGLVTSIKHWLFLPQKRRKCTSL